MTQEKFDLLLNNWLADTKKITTFKEKTNHPSYKELLECGNDSFELFIEYFKSGQYKKIRFQNITPIFGMLTKITGARPVKQESFDDYDLCVRDWIDYYNNEYKH